MSKIKLTGSNSGYVEISSAADAGNLTLALPTSGTALLSNAGNVFTGITTFTGVNITDDVTFTGASYNVLWDKSDNQLEFGDNAKLSFGASSDLQIYHDGSNDHILSSGTGSLLIKGDAINLGSASGQYYVRAFENADVQIRYNNSTKIQTTNTGAVVTGICTATSFSGSGENLTRTTQLSHRNLIINGSMQVAQRGTSSTTSGMKTVDRWTNNWSGGGVTQSQVSEQTGTVFENGFSNYLRLTNTSNTTTDTDYRFIGQTIEAQNVANSGWNFKSSSSYVTLTAWVRSSLAGTYYGWLNSRDGTGQTYTFSYTLSANTWTKITKTIPGNSNVAIHNNNEEGLVVHFIPWYGTYYSTSGHTLNTWITQSSTNRCPDFGQNWANTSNATFDVTGVQLEVGEQATPFEHRSYGEELARCQRYCYRLGGLGKQYQAVGTGFIGHNGSTDTGKVIVKLPTSMRTNPSVSVIGNTQGFWVHTGAAFSDMSAELTGPWNAASNYDSVWLDFGRTGGGSPDNGTACVVYSQSSNAAEMLFQAEI